MAGKVTDKNVTLAKGGKKLTGGSCAAPAKAGVTITGSAAGAVDYAKPKSDPHDWQTPRSPDAIQPDVLMPASIPDRNDYEKVGPTGSRASNRPESKMLSGTLMQGDLGYAPDFGSAPEGYRDPYGEAKPGHPVRKGRK